ncbi:hypothetical protein Rhsp01_56290 [Rhizobium sp. NBRC 114257]|uniref:Uncharacterized protein n=1 Tax=Rhizobium dioscoreae TaxID=2653122 RepID=A0ABQ0ZCI7_9HYPH|nr:hypothetical protein RsS93_56030 [Rhizobium dioscoreae]GLU84453.1 hypothetical protein Rhsp01_56290 [Rhizobium sp. NBRC 114257]
MKLRFDIGFRGGKRREGEKGEEEEQSQNVPRDTPLCPFRDISPTRGEIVDGGLCAIPEV